MCGRVLHVCFVLLAFSMSIGFWMVLDTRSNTSFKIASRHIMEVYNDACVKSMGKRFYVRAPLNEIENSTTVGGTINGMYQNSIIITSIAYNDIMAYAQYSQYTTKLPFIDDNGSWYFNTCEKLSYDMMGQSLMCSLMASILFGLILIIYLLVLSHFKKPRQDYSEI